MMMSFKYIGLFSTIVSSLQLRHGQLDSDTNGKIVIPSDSDSDNLNFNSKNNNYPSTYTNPTQAGQLFMKNLQSDIQSGKVIRLPSGLSYRILKKGDGRTHPLESTPCDVHYEGSLVNGDKFDSSSDHGDGVRPASFAPNQVIKGWTEAMTQLMVEGDKFELYIPPELAYGNESMGNKIPGGSTLVFKIELVKVKGPGKAISTVELANHPAYNPNMKRGIDGEILVSSSSSSSSSSSAAAASFVENDEKLMRKSGTSKTNGETSKNGVDFDYDFLDSDKNENLEKLHQDDSESELE